MEKRPVIAVGVVIGVAAAAYLYTLYSPGKVPPPSPSSASNFQTMAQQRGEAAMKKQIALSKIAAYVPLQNKYPESQDLKKKLALAYFDAEMYEKALPLLKEVARTIPSDDQVVRAIITIQSLTQKP